MNIRGNTARTNNTAEFISLEILASITSGNAKADLRFVANNCGLFGKLMHPIRKPCVNACVRYCDLFLTYPCNTWFKINGETGDGNSCGLLSRVALGNGRKHACTGLSEAGTLCCWVTCLTSLAFMLVATSATVTMLPLVEVKTGVVTLLAWSTGPTLALKGGATVRHTHCPSCLQPQLRFYGVPSPSMQPPQRSE